jgi:hypothetical protein
MPQKKTSRPRVLRGSGRRASYKTATLKFPAIPHLLGLDAFDVSNFIERSCARRR